MVRVGTTSYEAKGYSRDNPYCWGVVQLDEGSRISALLLGADSSRPDSIKIEQPVEVVFPESYPASVHDPAAVEFMRRAAAFLGPDGVFEIEPTTGAEDFAYYGQVVPSCQGSLGLRPPGAADAPNLHSATFDFNDDALPIGIRLFCELALGAGESDDEQGGEEE